MRTKYRNICWEFAHKLDPLSIRRPGGKIERVGRGCYEREVRGRTCTGRASPRSTTGASENDLAARPAASPTAYVRRSPSHVWRVSGRRCSSPGYDQPTLTPLMTASAVVTALLGHSWVQSSTGTGLSPRLRWMAGDARPDTSRRPEFLGERGRRRGRSSVVRLAARRDPRPSGSHRRRPALGQSHLVAVTILTIADSIALLCDRALVLYPSQITTLADHVRRLW